MRVEAALQIDPALERVYSVVDATVTGRETYQRLRERSPAVRVLLSM